MRGKLILCGTPIGNLEDISERAKRVLAEADIVACEDTRRTRKLLSHLGVTARDLVVYNDTTERRQAPSLVDSISKGRTVVLVSDAGMPGLSDPGFRLVREAVAHGLGVEVVPGPNAAVSALAISGIAPGRYVFEGFLPRRSSERKRHLMDLIHEPRALVFYESPHRLLACLIDLAEVLGGSRPAALARELTKMYEEVRRGTLEELVASASADPPRGEIVIVVEGAVREHRAEAAPEELASAARELMESGVPRAEALQTVAKTLGVPRRAVFDALVKHQ